MKLRSFILLIAILNFYNYKSQVNICYYPFDVVGAKNYCYEPIFGIGNVTTTKVSTPSFRSYDILIINHFIKTYSVEEKDSIVSFINNGGHAIISCEACIVSGVGKLMATVWNEVTGQSIIQSSAGVSGTKYPPRHHNSSGPWLSTPDSAIGFSTKSYANFSNLPSQNTLHQRNYEPTNCANIEGISAVFPSKPKIGNGTLYIQGETNFPFKSLASIQGSPLDNHCEALARMHYALINQDQQLLDSLNNWTKGTNILGNDTVICVGNAINITKTAPLGTTYSWEDENQNILSTNQSYIFNDTGCYLLRITLDTAPCQLIDTFKIQYTNPPNVDFTVTSSCEGDSTIFQNLTSTTLGIIPNYFWDFGNGSTSILTNPKVIYNSTGTFNVKLTSNVGLGCIDSVIKSVQIDPKPQIHNLKLEHVNCFGNSNGLIKINENIPNLNYLYRLDSTNFNSTNIFNNLPPGIYKLEVSNGNCTLDSILQITQPDSLYGQSSSTDLICFNDSSGSLQISVNGGKAPYSVSIDGGNIYFPIFQFNNLNAGNYDIIIKDKNNCEVILKDTLFEPNKIQTSITPDSCYSDSALISIWASGGIGSLNFNWRNQNAFTSFISVKPVTDQKYIVEVTDQNLCKALDSVWVKINPIINISVDEYKKCTPGEFQFTNSSISQNTILTLWEFGNGNTSDNFNTSNVYHQPGVYDVSLHIEDLNGCFKDSLFTNLLEVIETPTSLFTPSFQQAFTTNSSLDFTNNSISYLTNTWYISNYQDTFFTNDLSYDFPNDMEQTYEICLIATNLSCHDTSCQAITIKETFNLFVPNSFTPNKDGVNDVLLPIITGVEETNYSFTIYNKWGKKIFDNNNINEYWDGNFTNKAAKVGTYIWKINYQLKGSSEINSKIGHVNLIK